MDPPGLGIYRRQTLTNCAAEFVETGAGMDTVAQIIDSDDMDELQAISEFAPELDQFVPKGVIVDITKCYQESEKRMAKFQQTLQSFVYLLRERNVDKELNIEIKDPGDLTMEDVLTIIGKIQESRNTKQVKSCKDFIHKCYRKAESKRGIAEAALTMIPNDAYGSVISGGFTLILAAVEKHAEHRKAMQEFLAEIPEQLERLHRRSKLHPNSLRVHEQRDAVLVSIFVVLERIVDHLTKSWRAKVKNKVKVIFGNSKSKSSTEIVTATDPAPDTSETKQSVTEALKDFRSQVEQFEEEVQEADSERLGRIDNTSAFVKKGVIAIAKEVRDNRDWIERFVKETTAANMKSNGAIEGGRPSDDRSQKELIHLLFTTLYQFHASNPVFDPRTGQLNLEEMAREEQRRRNQMLLDAGPGTSPPSFKESNQRTVQKWLDRLKSKTGLSAYDFIEDARAILSSQHKLDHDQRDQCNYISWTAPEYKTWLKIDSASLPSLLNINLQTPPGIHNPVNPLSFTTARTAVVCRMQQSQHKTDETRLHSPKWPVLAFFCRQRNMASRNIDISGPPALVRSLCAQLLEWIALYRPGIDLESSIKTRDYFHAARKDIRDALRLFRALLLVLRDDDYYQPVHDQPQQQPRPQLQPVWILIDGLSSLSIAPGGTTSDSHNTINTLWHIINELSRPRPNTHPQSQPGAPGGGGGGGGGGLAIKLLVTDAFGTSPIRHVQGTGVLNLHVPNTPAVAGGPRGVLDGGSLAAEIRGLIDQQMRTKSSTEGGDGEVTSRQEEW